MIPHVFHRIWVGGCEPEWLRPYAQTWLDHNPGWELVQWGDGDLPPLVNQDIYDSAEQIAGPLAGQLRADVARYEILHRFGGVYVDADFECVRPFGGLLEGVSCFAAWEKQDVWVNQAIFGSVPSHPFVGRLIGELPGSVERNAGARPATMSGPKFLTPLWREHGESVTVFDERLFYPYSHSDVRRVSPSARHEGVYAVHHWGNKRRERGLL